MKSRNDIQLATLRRVYEQLAQMQKDLESVKLVNVSLKVTAAKNSVADALGGP